MKNTKKYKNNLLQKRQQLIKEGEKEDITSMATYNPDEEWVGLTGKEAFTLFLEETKREYDKYCDIIMRDLKVLEVIARICADKENWVNAEFGVDGSKLYIDGFTAYENENEKEIVNKWLKEIRK